MSTSVSIVEDVFGETTQPGTGQTQTVRRFTLSNASRGIKVQVITYGATITSIVVPDSQGRCEDVVLGFDDMSGYLAANNPYFGATIGRVCNRIADGKFRLNGHTYTLAKNNNGTVHLHGGFIGFDKYNWDAVVVGDTVRMTHVSADGEEGYPGAVLATVTIGLGGSDGNELSVQFQATAAKPTPINLTNHSYFNLAGHAAGAAELYRHTVTLNADRITETNGASIPSGAFTHVIGTPFDLRTPRELGVAMRALPAIGYDDNYCVTGQPSSLSSGSASAVALQFVGAVIHRDSGRSLEVYSDQPGVQLYTANYMPDPRNEIYPPNKERAAKAPNSSAAIAGKAGAKYFKHGAFCLETQKYPDSVNHANFPTTIVNPGDIYRHQVVYKFSCDAVQIIPL